ncbi:MAG: hypothetical protein PGN07_01810 [Aeromicrobium erythreum]
MATTQRTPGKRRSVAQASAPVSSGALPSATIVPIATPVALGAEEERRLVADHAETPDEHGRPGRTTGAGRCRRGPSPEQQGHERERRAADHDPRRPEGDDVDGAGPEGPGGAGRAEQGRRGEDEQEGTHAEIVTQSGDLGRSSELVSK